MFLLAFMAATFLIVTLLFRDDAVVDEALAQNITYCDCVPPTPEPPTPTSGGEA